MQCPSQRVSMMGSSFYTFEMRLWTFKFKIVRAHACIVHAAVHRHARTNYVPHKRARYTGTRARISRTPRAQWIKIDSHAQQKITNKNCKYETNYTIITISMMRRRYPSTTNCRGGLKHAAKAPFQHFLINRTATSYYFESPLLKPRFYLVKTRLTTQLRYNRNSITCILKLWNLSSDFKMIKLEYVIYDIY